MIDALNPFDVNALEGAVNDSSTRVSTIWTTFLVFSVYLLIAIGTVTHRQLFLSEPTKLPVLNIDMPLWWFFLLAPLFFVTLHLYVLLQVLLLGRTTAAYDAAVTRAGLPSSEELVLRQRLANTLFAQLLAGSPRERTGFIGSLLKTIAWTTLAFAPILIVLAFQFRFLPYHSHLVTWTHRFLIVVELVALFLIWPLALDAHRNVEWSTISAEIRRSSKNMAAWLLKLKDARHERLGVRPTSRSLAASFLIIVVITASFFIATFPGEPHVNLFTGHLPNSVQCKRWFSRFSKGFDRLDLQRVEVFKREEDRGTNEKALTNRLSLGLIELGPIRQVNFEFRDLNCSSFGNANLRRADFVGAAMTGADLEGADLRGANLTKVTLKGARIGIGFLGFIGPAQLQGANLLHADLRGASLLGVPLQGADLRFSNLLGADLRGANLQGVNLEGVRLSGANLVKAELQGASIKDSDLQGADLQDAQLEGAIVINSRLQGANLKGAKLHLTAFRTVDVWRTKRDSCFGSSDSLVTNPNSVPSVSRDFERGPIPATRVDIEKFMGLQANEWVI